MFAPNRIGITLFLLLTIVSTTRAQEETAHIQPATELPVTVAATTERVRFAAPSAVVQLRLEVYDEAGRKVFDTEQRGGSVLDWHLQDGTGARLSDGTYL